MIRLASGKGQVQQALADTAVARLVTTWAKAAKANVSGDWPGAELVDAATALGTAMKEANPTAPGSATVGHGAAMVALTAQRAPKGAGMLHSDLPSAHHQFLTAFARAAGLLVHVHAMLPGRGLDAELAAVTALGHAWPMPLGASSKEPSSKLSKAKLVAMSKAIAGGPTERRDLPEVAGARRRSAEIRKPGKKVLGAPETDFPKLPADRALDRKRRSA